MAVRVLVDAEAVGGTLDDPALDRLLVRAVQTAAAERAATEGEFSLTLLGDPGIADLNQRFLGHSGPTDVIAFALYEPGELPVADIYIGYEQAVRQAGEHEVPLAQELARLAVHGTLHVLGEDHPGGDDRTTSAMWLLQERIVSALFEHG